MNYFLSFVAIACIAAFVWYRLYSRKPRIIFNTIKRVLPHRLGKTVLVEDQVSGLPDRDLWFETQKGTFKRPLAFHLRARYSMSLQEIYHAVRAMFAHTYGVRVQLFEHLNRNTAVFKIKVSDSVSTTYLVTLYRKGWKRANGSHCLVTCSISYSEKP